MIGYILLIGFIFCGVIAARALFADRCALIRLWLGISLGLLMMMCLPALFAFMLDFTRAAQLSGLGAAVLIAGGCAFIGRGKTVKQQPFCGDMPIWIPLCLLIPLVGLSAYLQYTHILREVNGALHVGQSTYGDLCLHLGIATSLQNAPFPPDYSILPGVLLGYPFLSDSMVTTMLLFGSDLAASFVITGTLMMVLTYAGFIVLTWEITKSRGATVLAFVFMFINGGLGFLYTFDGVFRDSGALREVFTGFYKTPTNQPDLNLRWVNVICDMMIPQRTLLGGWCMLMPALYMLTCAMKTRRRGDFVLLGIWAGCMPMIHTHSFFALGLASTGVCVYDILHASRTERRDRLLCYTLYAVCAVGLAAPQLLKWTFPQTVGGGSLRFRFNWVNNQGNGRLIDGYFWFWIKNVGLNYILMVPAALLAKKGSRERALAIGALVIYTVAEFIQFQPNEYDNNKLFYVAYMLMMPLIGSCLIAIWDRLRGLKLRGMLACLFIGVGTISGGLSIAREVISDYQLFSPSEVAAADYIKENLPEKCVVLTGQQHCNAVAALTGRYIVCGTGSYLYFHGIDYSPQLQACCRMFEDPAENRALFNEYGVGYIYISGWERSAFDIDTQWYAENAALIFERGDVCIYALPELN